MTRVNMSYGGSNRYDNTRVKRILCGAIAFMDGFDAQSIGYVAPALSSELQIARVALGPGWV